MTQSTTTAEAPQRTLAELVEHLTEFDGPPEQFLVHLLAVQCQVGQAAGGAILRVDKDSQAEILAVFPALDPGQTAPVWLAHAVEVIPRVAEEGNVVVRPLQNLDGFYQEQPNTQLILMPLRGSGGVRGVAAFLIHSSDQAFLAHCRERLELTISLLSLYEMRLTLQVRRGDLHRMREALEVLAAINEQSRFKAAGMAFCNEVAARWKANRVSLGFLRGRYVKMSAMAHTEKFTRKTKLVQDIESAMEECLDQDQEILEPAGPDAQFVNRSARELALHHGPTTVLSLPMRSDGEVVAVLAVERAPDQPFGLEEVETLRLTCDLSTARLMDLHEHDKWIGAQAAGAMRKGLASLLGPKHTWIKVAVLGVFSFILFLCLAEGPFRAEASFMIEATERRIVPAPFDGFLDQVYIDPNDPVVANETVLAQMDTSELSLSLAQATADRNQKFKENDLAMSQGEFNQAQIAQAQVESFDAQIRRLEYQRSKAKIKSPLTGVVITGDLRRQEGAPLQRGDVMFEVAPLESLRAKLYLPEKRIADVLAAQLLFSIGFGIEDDLSNGSISEELRQAFENHGNPLSKEATVMVEEEDRRWRITDQGTSYSVETQTNALQISFTLVGTLASRSDPGQYIPFEIERINPVAEVVDQNNVFQIRARLRLDQVKDPGQWLRPGIEGVAKIDLGRRRYAWLWTREPVNWIRMKLWL